MGVRKLVALLVLAALLAAGVSACGDSGDDTTATTSTPAANGTAQEGSSKATGGDGAGRSSGQDGGGTEKPSSSEDDSSSAGSKVAAVPLQVSGGGSAQFRTPGGDNSIQNFGDEADESELEEAAEVVHGFLAARTEEDWPTACSYFSKSMVQQLEQLASQSEQLRSKGCAAILNALTASVPSTTAKELTEVDAASLRHDDESAFLLYRGAEKKAYFMPMAEEDGTWKVSALAPTPIL